MVVYELFHHLFKGYHHPKGSTFSFNGDNGFQGSGRVMNDGGKVEGKVEGGSEG